MSVDKAALKFYKNHGKDDDLEPSRLHASLRIIFISHGFRCFTLETGIILLLRTNRIPKPKNVCRNEARALDNMFFSA